MRVIVCSELLAQGNKEYSILDADASVHADAPPSGCPNISSSTPYSTQPLPRRCFRNCLNCRVPPPIKRGRKGNAGAAPDTALEGKSQPAGEALRP